MNLTLASIVVLLILSIVWFILKYRNDLRKDKEIFNEYLRTREKDKNII
jgi:hypothetical protein